MVCAQPWSLASFAFSSLLTVPMTVAPRCLAHCERMVPTPPAAAVHRDPTPPAVASRRDPPPPALDVQHSVELPIGAGVADTLARRGRNVTGFMNYEYSLSGKWLEVLKQIEPRLTHAAVIRNAANPASIAQFGAIRSTASSLGVDVSPISIGDAGEIERAIADFARSPNGGLIVTPGAASSVHHTLIVTLAARYKLPAVYADRFSVTSGGLISYGPEGTDQFRRAADYVDRILKGEKPADLPVHTPTKFELVINLGTEKTLGLTMPPSLLARADEVIE